MRPAPTYTANRRDTPAAASTAPPSSIVSLSAAGQAAAQAATEAPTPQLSPAVRFRDAGATLLASLTTRKTVGVEFKPVPHDATHGFTLSVVTARGTKVDLSLATTGDGMTTQIAADAELGNDEREALAGLAQGFQDMIDGMVSDTPRIRLGGLAQLDTSVLQSIDVHAAVTLPTIPPAAQSLDFHIDAEQRTMAADGPAGKVDVTVKTSTLESLGSKAQQTKAIDGYLKQFDRAATRGHGDAGLMSMFKDAFSDLSRTAKQDDPAGQVASKQGSVPGFWQLRREDRAVLTGLADFSASITQTPQYNNPVHRDEVDSFQYEVSQDTRADGKSRTDRTLAQAQQSRLTARFHEPLQPGTPLAFSFAAETQNYTYHQIDDAARSNVELGYKDGKLRRATMEQSVTQSERIQQYVLGRMMSDKTIPTEQHLVRDLLTALSPYKVDEDGGAPDANSEAREARRETSLDALGDQMLLLGGATDLAARDRQL